MANTVSSKEQKLASRAILLSLSNICSSISIILIFVLLSYTLNKVAYGNFRQIWLINKNLLEVFALGIPLSIFYFLPRLKEDRKKSFIIQSLLILSAFGAIFTLFIFVLANKIGLLFNNPELGKYLRYFCIYPLFILPTLGLQSILVSLGKAIQFSIFTIVDRFLLLILVGASLLIFQSLEAIIFTIVIYASFEFVVSIYLSLYFIKDKKNKTKKFEIFKQIKFAFPSGAANIVGIFNQEIDKIMIATYFSVTQFAKYANGAFEIPFVGTVASSVTAVLLPEFANRNEKGDYKSLLQLWHGAIRKVAIFFIPIMIFLMIFSTDFITLMFSEKYSDSSLIFRIYLIALLPRVTWYGPILVAMGYNKEPFIGSSIALCSNVSLNYLLIKTIGFIGPAIATVIATYIVTFYYLSRIKRVTNVKLKRVFPWTDLFKMLIIALIVGIFLIPITYLGSVTNITKISIGIIGYFIPVYLLFAKMKLIQKSDIQFIANSFRKIQHILTRSG